MFRETWDQVVEETARMRPFTSLPLALAVEPDIKLYKLLADLSHDTPWADRQTAARKLGRTRSLQALPGLLEALHSDPFWMVRCAIIQALEMIGDHGAIPMMRKTAGHDGFQVVRSYARKAIERLSPGENPSSGYDLMD